MCICFLADLCLFHLYTQCEVVYVSFAVYLANGNGAAGNVGDNEPAGDGAMIDIGGGPEYTVDKVGGAHRVAL